jgi:hypothetical protein
VENLYTKSLWRAHVVWLGGCTYGASFDIMIVPAAANVPPTPWQTEIFGAANLGGGDAAHPAHAILQGVHAGMHIRKTAAIGVERQLAAGGGVALDDEGAGTVLHDGLEVDPRTEFLSFVLTMFYSYTNFVL